MQQASKAYPMAGWWWGKREKVGYVVAKEPGAVGTAPWAENV